MASFNNEWRLKGAKEAQDEEDEGTVVILDTGCTKATCSRHAYHLMEHELLPDLEHIQLRKRLKSLGQ